ncbi:MAG: histidine kinase [Ferruginibacter sp.]
MRYAFIIISFINIFYLKAQEDYPANKLPVFKQVTHPFMPPITSAYFFFSEDGFIWFSTPQGLTSFDGSEVTYYSSIQQANSFGLNRIFSMTEDKGHNFYIGTPIGLFYYDRKSTSFTHLSYMFSDNHQRPNISFGALYFDTNGMVYAGSGANGLFIYDPVNKKLDHFNMDTIKPDSWTDRWKNTVNSFATHAVDSNKLWVGTFHGIFLFDKKRKIFKQQFEVINPGSYLPAKKMPEDYDIQKMDVADDSTIWFNSWTYGFGKYNTNTGKVKLFLHDARLKTPTRYIGYIMPKFARLSPGKYLLGIYDYKTAIFDCQTETVQYFTVTKNNYPDEQTRFVTNDRQGKVWLLQRGLLYVAVPANTRLQTVEIPNPNKFTFPILQGIYFEKTTSFFYGAFLYDTGVHVFDTSFHPVKIIPVPLFNNYYVYNTGVANSVTRDGSGRFWTAGPESYVLPQGGEKFLHVKKAFPSMKWIEEAKDEIEDVITTKSGDLLYKNTAGVIYHVRYQSLHTDTIRPPAGNWEGVSVKASSQWYDAKRNFIYMIKSTGGARYNLNNKQTTTIPYQSLFGNLPSHSGICMSAMDEDGHLWFMIPKYGIRILNPETLYCEDSIPYGTRGLIRGDYTFITGAEKPFMLLLSQNGVVVYDYSKQQSFLFDRDNGLSGPENKALLYCNGYMLIAEDGRFEYFKLSNLKKYSLALKSRLNTIVADTSLIYLNSGNDSAAVIRLPHYQNWITLSFSAQEFIFPERIEYAYQFKPLDNDWHYTDYFNREITFTKLAPGKYIFRLRAQMQGGNWDTMPMEYTIIITPAWWQTGWFKLLCIIAIMALIIYFIQKRIQFIRKTEQQKSRQEKELLELEAKALRAQMNPHFIFNCLNSIKSLIQENENEKSVTYLTTFSKLIRTLLNNADKKEISLYDEIETCRLYLQLEAIRFDTKFSFTVNVDNTIDLKSIKVPALIIQPFIENAIWHGIVPRNNGGQVSLNAVRKNNIIEVAVEDDGIGRESSQQNKSASGLSHQSKGVSLTQSRLELNNLLHQRQAKLEIIDKKDEKGNATGTIVIIKINEELL